MRAFDEHYLQPDVSDNGGHVFAILYDYKISEQGFHLFRTGYAGRIYWGAAIDPQG